VALIACTVIYALVQWVVVGVLGPGATTDRPLAEVARITMGNRGAGLVCGLGRWFGVRIFEREAAGMPRLRSRSPKVAICHRCLPWLAPDFTPPGFRFCSMRRGVGAGDRRSFAWNVTLSVVARLFYYAVVCAALIALRRKQPLASGFRLPGGRYWRCWESGLRWYWRRRWIE